MKRVYLIAVIVALIAGGATYLFASSLIQRSSIEDAPTQTVLVAIEDVPAGTQILPEDIELMFVEKKVLVQDVTPNAVTNSEEIINQVAAQTIYAGEQLSMNRFITSGSDNADLSYALAEGEVAYSIKAEAEKGVDGYVKPGDTVDVVAYYMTTDKDGQKTGSKTTMEFSDLKVLKVATYEDTKSAQSEGEGGEVVKYVSLTVKTTDEQAIELYNMENEAMGFKMILNAKVDAEKID